MIPIVPRSPTRLRAPVSLGIAGLIAKLVVCMRGRDEEQVRTREGILPWWAFKILRRLNRIEQLIGVDMALDRSLLARVLAGAQSLAQQALAAAEREKAKDAKIAELQGELGQTQADLSAEQQEDVDANQALSDTANALDGLLQSDQTPVVETPAPGDAPGVVDGSGDAPVVTDPGPIADGTITDDSGDAGTDPATA